MRTSIRGKLTALRDDAAILEVGNFEYEVLLPEISRRGLQTRLGEEVRLHTVEYLDGNPAHGKLVPRFIGFTSPVEREFFDLFCSVDGVGAKKALRAMERPVREIATAIEEQDVKSLATLPGIGLATAERIVAKLKRKVPKFALLVARIEPSAAETKLDLVREVYEVLRQLGHQESDARKLIDKSLETKKKYTTVEDFLQAIYAQNRPG